MAMSGGVDSSVAAALLKEQGYSVTGLTMKIWDGKEKPDGQTRQSCYGPGEEQNIETAGKVCRILDIPFHVIDLTDEFREEVLDYFSAEYLSGRTPNPCLRCNSKIKFTALVRKAGESGIESDYFATGHYSRVEYSKDGDRYLLKKGKDTGKDQSYFVASLSQEQLSRTLFPLGGLSKDEVKNIARNTGLGVAEKAESQDFIAAGYRSLIKDSAPGMIKNTKGEILGEHRGIAFFTIGQRKGLGISKEEPLYVTDIDPETNTVFVGGRDEIYGDEFTASGLNWISREKPDDEMRVTAKIRYAHRGAEAIITPLGDDGVRVKFREPQMAITPGQAAVFYSGDTVVGSGIIERMEK